jgi:hypothetical protein
MENRSIGGCGLSIGIFNKINHIQKRTFSDVGLDQFLIVTHGTNVRIPGNRPKLSIAFPTAVESCRSNPVI